MSEVLTTATDQPSQASESSHEPFAWLNESNEAEQAADTPEPTAEAVEDGSLETETESPQPEGENETSSMDEYLAALSPEERTRYAKRYPNAWKLANDPNQPEDVRQLLRDKINTDFEYKKLREQPAAEEEPTLDDETDEPAAEASSDPQQIREQHYAQVDAITKSFDPKEVEAFGREVLEMFGVDLNSKDPEIAAIVAKAPQIGEKFSRRLVDGVMTILSRTDIVGNAIEQSFPGTSENYARYQAANAWESVRQSNPAFAKLPEYGKKSGDFGKMMQKVVQENPFLAKMQFKGSDAQQAREFYALVAELATKNQGQKATPVEVAAALETGQKQAQARQKQISAGRALGAGKSNSTIDNGKDDNSFRSWIEEYNASNRSTGAK